MTALKITQTSLPLECEMPAPSCSGWIAMAFYAPGGYWREHGFHRTIDDAKEELRKLGTGWQHRQIYKIGEPQR